MDLEKIFQFNRKWAIEKTQEKAEYFLDLERGQSPKMLYIGCSDSRVAAEVIMGAQPGDIFVHRNVANLVPKDDHSSRAVVNYAVDHLGVEDIVVCGHYGCGGVKAAMGDDDLGVLNPWIDNVRKVYADNRESLEKIGAPTAQYEKLVELNVAQQCHNLSELPEVKAKQDSGAVKVHGWIFDIGTGLLRDLEINVGGSIW